MVTKMLKDGLIQHSQIYYSSPVILVHIKDGSGCMCVYYRETNNITIKYKFPISIIDEFFDEVHGVVYFMKLDIQSSYHQVKMKKENIPKTTS